MPSVQELLGGPLLSGVTQRIPSGLTTCLPPEYMTPTRRNDGPLMELFIEEGHQDNAQIIHYDAPSRSTGKQNLILKPVNLLHSKHHQDFAVSAYQNLLHPDGSAQRALGEFELNRQTQALKAKFSNTRISATQMALAKGYIWLDANGSVQPTSSSAKMTIDYGIPAGHRNQLDVFGAGAIIGAKWSATDTDIHMHVQAIKAAAARRGGLPITTAFYGKNVFDYILKNTKVQALLQSNANLAASFTNNEIPAGFLGIPKWISTREAYLKYSGSYYDVWGDDDITFAPDVAPTWYDFVEGSYVVPKELMGTSQDAQQLVNAYTQIVYGMFSYAHLMNDPITARQIMGDTFLPVIRNNYAIFIASVHWS